MVEKVRLFHGTDYDRLGDIEVEGLRTPVSRGEVPDLENENAMKYQSIYLYDPEELSNWIKEEFNDVFVECSVPEDNLFVTRYGAGSAEDMLLSTAEEKLNTYREYEGGELPYREEASLMFLHPGDIGPEQLHALAWSI